MCLTCGCMDAHLAMGESNITYEDIKRAADENSRSVAETLEIMEKTKGQLPAPLAALDAIAKGCNLPLDQGLKVESDCFPDACDRR